jgi:hypothetical protein
MVIVGKGKDGLKILVIGIILLMFRNNVEPSRNTFLRIKSIRKQSIDN